jgi:hypothetical protein
VPNQQRAPIQKGVQHAATITAFRTAAIVAIVVVVVGSIV